MPTADVLIPAYNAASTLRETIESIQRQTVPDFRIIIVNDGSKDATGALADELAAADHRIEVFHKENGGIVEALNDGLKRCTAEFLFRIDADDLAYPDRMEKQIAYLRANRDVVAVACSMRHIDEHGRPLGSVAEMGPTERADPYFTPTREPYLIHPAVTIRREAVERIGGYRQVHLAEDTDLYWRLLALGRLVNSKEILGDYRMHAASISSASILNGRIASIGSQLSGLSERRRREGRPDFEFHKEDLATFRSLGRFRAMIGFAGERLEPEERIALRRLAVAKLLELTSYRPYEADSEDCALIGEVAREGFGPISALNLGMLRRQIAGAAARIALADRMDDARAMLPPGLYPSFAARLAMRRYLPDPIRRAVRIRGGRRSPSK